MKLYVFPPSPRARKVMAVAAHAGTPCEMQFLDLTKGEQKKPEYLELNPNGRMPTLVDGGVVLWEAQAIMQYLALKAGHELWPKDDSARIDIARWQFWDLAHWETAYGPILFERVVKKVLGMGEPDAARVREGEERMREFGAVLDRHLRGREWMVGKTPSLADYALAAPLMYVEAAHLPIGGFAQIKSWFARVEQLEGWKKTQPKS